MTTQLTHRKAERVLQQTKLLAIWQRIRVQATEERDYGQMRVAAGIILEAQMALAALGVTG